MHSSEAAFVLRGEKISQMNSALINPSLFLKAHVAGPHCPLFIDILLLKLLDSEFVVDLTADVAPQAI